MLTPHEHRVLHLILAPGANCSSVAHEVGLTPQAVHYTVRQLVKKGWIEKHGRFRKGVRAIRDIHEAEVNALAQARAEENARREACRRDDGTVDLEKAWETLDDEDRREIGVAALKMVRFGLLPRGMVGAEIADVVAIALPGLFEEKLHA